MAMIVRLPRTQEGRALLRDVIAERDLHEIYPDGSRLANIDWDLFAIQVAESIRSYEAFCAERQA